VSVSVLWDIVIPKRLFEIPTIEADFIFSIFLNEKYATRKIGTKIIY
jgi:hypothetical protein